MKKRFLKGSLTLMLASTLFFQSCIGSFGLTNNLYNWNNEIGDRFVNTLVFAAFVIVPVYGVTLFLDGIIFNSIEFWSGSNPITMQEGEEEIQQFTRDGITYEIRAVKNKFIATQLVGPQAGESVEFVFDPSDQSWTLITKDFTRKLVKHNSDNTVHLFYPDKTVQASLYELSDQLN